MAVLNVVLAALLFDTMAAAPASEGRARMFAVVSGVCSILAAWYAIRVWRATGATAARIVASVALLIDIAILGFAAMFGLVTFFNPIAP